MPSAALSRWIRPMITPEAMGSSQSTVRRTSSAADPAPARRHSRQRHAAGQSARIQMSAAACRPTAPQFHPHQRWRSTGSAAVWVRSGSATFSADGQVGQQAVALQQHACALAQFQQFARAVGIGWPRRFRVPAADASSPVSAASGGTRRRTGLRIATMPFGTTTSVQPGQGSSVRRVRGGGAQVHGRGGDRSSCGVNEKHTPSPAERGQRAETTMSPSSLPA